MSQISTFLSSEYPKSKRNQEDNN